MVGVTTMTPAADFKEFLETLAPMTPDDLQAAVDELPLVIRERLARGPLERRWSCGVCEAFGGAAFYKGILDADDPVWRAWGYHEVPKAQMRHRDQLHHGPLANEIYERCIATYRAAGWTGDAPEANA